MTVTAARLHHVYLWLVAAGQHGRAAAWYARHGYAVAARDEATRAAHCYGWAHHHLTAAAFLAAVAGVGQ